MKFSGSLFNGHSEYHTENLANRQTMAFVALQSHILSQLLVIY